MRVIDGDTLEVRVGLRRYRVRLLGIDAPESRWGRRLLRQAHATGRGLLSLRFLAWKAKRHTRRIVGYRRVELDPLGPRDRYGRMLAYVSGPGGVDLGKELLRRGLALASDGGHPRRQEYRRCEALARAARRGLWR